MSRHVVVASLIRVRNPALVAPEPVDTLPWHGLGIGALRQCFVEESGRRSAGQAYPSCALYAGVKLLHQPCRDVPGNGPRIVKNGEIGSLHAANARILLAAAWGISLDLFGQVVQAAKIMHVIRSFLAFCHWPGNLGGGKG